MWRRRCPWAWCPSAYRCDSASAELFWVLPEGKLFPRTFFQVELPVPSSARSARCSLIFEMNCLKSQYRYLTARLFPSNDGSSTNGTCKESISSVHAADMFAIVCMIRSSIGRPESGRLSAIIFSRVMPFGYFALVGQFSRRHHFMILTRGL